MMTVRARNSVFCVTIFLLGSFLGIADDESPEPGPKKQYRTPVLIQFYGEINPLSEQSFYRKLAVARSMQADLVVVEIESPGGWVESSLNMAERLRQIDWARTVAFVPQEAISGGAIAALGCDDIVMAPDALLGDAGEIFRDEQGVFRYVPEKPRSYLAPRLRLLAEDKGRAPALAEAMCDMDMVVFHVRHLETGKETFLSQAEIDSAENPNQWQKLKPVFGTRAKHFLTVNGKEAIELKLASALAGDRDELKKVYDLSRDFTVLRHTWIDTAVVILNTPLVTGFLIVVGLIALYLEFSLPGTFVGGTIAGLCFLLFFWSRFLGGTAGWLELTLFLAGLAFLAMELFVLPGFGISGITGILLLIGSVVMASQTFIVPNTGRELDVTLAQFGIVLTSGVVFLAACGVISRYLGAIPIARSLVLEVPTAGQTADEGSLSGKDDTLPRAAPGIAVTLGEQGIADSPLRPAGKVRFGDRYVDVISDGMFIDRGQAVRVVEVSGYRVVVREVES